MRDGLACSRLASPVENGVLSDSKEVWEQRPKSECPSRASNGRGETENGSAAVPKEAILRCRLQEPHGGFADAFAQRRLTKRSRDGCVGEVRPQLEVNKAASVPVFTG
jgi:hypothetical protein